MAALGLKSYILDNNLKSGLLLAGFPVLLTLIAWALGLLLMGLGYLPTTGALEDDLALSLRLLWGGVPLAFLVAAAWFLVAYATQNALVALATGARPVARADEPELYNLVENLCISRGLKDPGDPHRRGPGAQRLRLGRGRAHLHRHRDPSLLDTLDRAELQAVLGHELTHIINRDTRLMMVCAVFAGIITFAAEMVFRAMRYSDLRSRRRENRKGGGFLVLIAFALLAVGYLLAVVLRFAISRKREFLADAGSVELTKDPDAMISALQKIDGHARLPAPAQVRPLFFEDRASGLFATHPPIAAASPPWVKYAGGRIEPVETAVPVTP